MSLSRTVLYAGNFLLSLFGVLLAPAFAQEQDTPAFPAQPVIAGNPFSKKSVQPQTAAAAPILFSIGNPTDEEQLYLELINRARADANAEAKRLIALDDIYVQSALQKVNTNQMQSQFATNPPAAPLSFSAKLLTAARNHAQYQFDNGIQSHFGPGTNSLQDRLNAVNYAYYWASENVYSYSQNVQYGHAAYEIDWTGDTANGGMQSPPGHRDHIHDGRFIEIGVGIVNGTNQVGANPIVGPQLVTEDFGNPFPATTYITGVAYYDLNGNNFYDLGEGLSGITVSIDGFDTYAVTSTSGGYSLPVTPGNTYTVRFKAAGVSDTISSINVSTTNNVKLDFKPTFVAPTVASAPPATYAGVSNLYTLTPFAGATSYRARIFTLQRMPLEGAEGPLTNVALTTFGNYTVISSTVKSSGSNSFRLGHMTDPSTGAAYPQLIQFVKPFYVSSGARIDFKSRLGVAYGGQTNPPTGPGETARVEISLDEGKTWTSIWSQAGSEQDHGADTSEKTFNARSVTLSNYAGKLVMLRFNFDVDTSVGWFEPNNDKYGWYIDDITITGAEQGTTSTPTTSDGSATFQFVPPTAGDYAMQFGATAGTRDFPMGPWYAVTAQSGPPMILPSDTTISGNSLSMRVRSSTSAVSLQSAPSLSGPWSTESTATITGPVNNEYTLSVPLNGSARFYRVVTN